MKCFVTDTYEEYPENAKAKTSEMTPAKLLDCKKWGNRKNMAWHEEVIRIEEELGLNKPDDTYRETCVIEIDEFITDLKQITWCTNDCQFCQIDTRQNDEGHIIEKFSQCAGPNDPHRIKYYPKNTCKTFNNREKRPITHLCGSFSCKTLELVLPKHLEASKSKK